MSPVGLEPWLFTSRQLTELPTKSSNKQSPCVEYVCVWDFVCSTFAAHRYRI